LHHSRRIQANLPAGLVSGEIHILQSDSTPKFLFCSDGRFKIRGRGFYKTETEAVGELINKIDEYLADPAEITYVVIALEYLNSRKSYKSGGVC
jgi:hypothetical protein